MTTHQPKVTLEHLDFDNNPMETVEFREKQVQWWYVNETVPDDRILAHSMGFLNRYLTRFRGPGSSQTLIGLYRTFLDMARCDKFDQARGPSPSSGEDEDKERMYVKDVFRSFFETIYGPDDRSQIIKYLRDWKNHPKMEVTKYSTRLKTLNAWVQWLPGDQEAMADGEIIEAIA